jgi:hypothetical protein
MGGPDGPVVNFYDAAEIDAGAAKLRIEGDYPRGGEVTVAVTPAGKADFALGLRIPAWSRTTAVRVNGEAVDGQPVAGKYLSIRRAWKAGDRVTLAFDMTARLERDPGKSTRVAVVRGPIVLAVESRFAAPQTGLAPATVVADAGGRIDAKIVNDALPAPALLALDVPVQAQDSRAAALRMCDYASACATWDSNTLFRVWLPQPLDLAAPLAGVKP